ncbi:MAG TPA: hypothetical protein EYH01_09395 [Campylobacterales bacterium]|nr:hypothetical protein [Campylobacterales bacterium]HIP60627.1 hypothetical protein [Campylobacterales bacterium]
MKIFLTIIMTIVFAISVQAEGMVADKKERDLICGMLPSKNPKWMTEIELSNDKKLHFASVKCMMLFYYKNDKWDDLGLKAPKPEERAAIFKALRVQDFNNLKVIDAKKAFYVFGAHIMSPKGDDLVPFQYEKDAENYMKENGGKKILTWKQFKLNLFDLLNL